MKLIPKILPILFIIYSCGGADHESVNSGNSTDDLTEIENQTTEAAEVSEETERMLIKTGDISFETKSIDSTRSKILKAVHHYDSYVASDNESKSYGRFSTTMVLRVPNKNFDLLLNEITEGVESFEHKNINVEDVTEEFVDIQARIKTKKELELRYLDLLKDAKSVTEMLEIEKQIGELRAEIESIEGRLKYLSGQVEYSTLTITFYELHEESKGWNNKFSKSFSQGWDTFIYLFVGLTGLWPFLTIGTIIFVIVRRIKRKKKKSGMV